MRFALVTTALAATLASSAPALARSVDSVSASEPQATETGNPVSAILGIVDVAREAKGRVQLALRSSDQVREAVDILSSFEGLASVVVPRFRLPVDLHPMPILTERPADGELSSPFGVRQDPIRKRRRKFHSGIDFHGKRGQPVRAAGPGVVTRARRNGGYGRVVYIDHGLGLETRYAHLQRIDVREGDFVAAGEPVGAIGSSGRSTGPHLHFEVRMRGAAVDPDRSMDIELFGQPSAWAVLASLLPGRAPSGGAATPPKKKRRRKKRTGPRRSRSERVTDLW